MADRIETDLLTRWQKKKSTEAYHMGLQDSNPMAHEYAKPLFDAGVTGVYLTRRCGYRGISRVHSTYHHVLIVLEGEIKLTIGRRRRTVSPGMIYTAPARCVYGRLVEAPTIAWIMFEVRPVALWRPLKAAAGHVRSYESVDCMRVLVNQLILAYETGNLARRRTAYGVAESVLALLKQELHMYDFRAVAHTAAIESLRGGIAADPAGDWTLKRMAKETRMSVRTLTRHCQRVFGTSPLELVHRRRLQVAHDLMKSDMSLEEVAARVGYSSPESFSNMFKRHMGMRPGQFQRVERGL